MDTPAPASQAITGPATIALPANATHVTVASGETVTLVLKAPSAASKALASVTAFVKANYVAILAVAAGLVIGYIVHSH